MAVRAALRVMTLPAMADTVAPAGMPVPVIGMPAMKLVPLATVSEVLPEVPAVEVELGAVAKVTPEMVVLAAIFVPVTGIPTRKLVGKLAPAGAKILDCEAGAVMP